uniref:Amiloride-sensitive sodium channel n=2 Tax=Steinernema glaseri TaxID=37863 RepID=A0A1I7Z9D4_9BILA
MRDYFRRSSCASTVALTANESQNHLAITLPDRPTVPSQHPKRPQMTVQVHSTRSSLEATSVSNTNATPWSAVHVDDKAPNGGDDRKLSVDSATQYEPPTPKRRGTLQRQLLQESDSDSDFELLERLYEHVKAKLNRQRSSQESSMEEEEHKKLTCKEIFVSKRMKKWAFWFIVAFLAALTLKDVVDLSHLANMTTHDAFLSQPWDYRMVMEAYEVIATFSSMERETTPHGSIRSINVYRTQARLANKRKMAKMWLDVLKERDVTFEEFTQKTGTEVIRRSMQRFQRTTYDEDLVIKTHLRTSWISMMQFCFQPWFDQDNFKKIDDQGNFFTMMLSHNMENLEGAQLECMSVDFHGRPSSLSRFMEGKGRARDGFNEELCAGMRHEVQVEVRARYVMLENDDEGTACREVEEGEDNEFDCRSRCRMKMIRDECKCTAASLSYLASDSELKEFPVCNYEKCEVDVQSKNFSDSDCTAKCYRSCDQIRYEIDHETKGRMVRPDLTLIDLNWGSFEYLTLEQDWVWTVPTFIAALGGSIGMWLGLSILSLIQGCTYLYSIMAEEVKTKVIEHKIRKASMVSPPPQLDEDGKEKNRFKENPFANPYAKKNPNMKSMDSTKTQSFDSVNGNPPRYDSNPHTQINVD